MCPFLRHGHIYGLVTFGFQEKLKILYSIWLIDTLNMRSLQVTLEMLSSIFKIWPQLTFDLDQNQHGSCFSYYENDENYFFAVCYKRCIWSNIRHCIFIQMSHCFLRKWKYLLRNQRTILEFWLYCTDCLSALLSCIIQEVLSLKFRTHQVTSHFKISRIQFTPSPLSVVQSKISVLYTSRFIPK